MKYLLSIIYVLCLSACVQQKHQTSQGLTSQIEVLKTVYYDGVNDDLLTAGLGLTGLRSKAPVLSSQPTAAELRQASYYHQYNALTDLTEAGGFGTLYGFKKQQKPIAGFEFWSQRKVAMGAYHTVIMQVPDNFDTQNACLVIAPSSGSRNVLGAVGTSGAWALTHRCAVVYTDKGTGTQVVINDGKAYQIDGQVKRRKLNVATAANGLLEATSLLPSSIHHVIQKHPYSQVNPEQYWGEFVLDAAEFGLALLKQQQKLQRDQVKVIAASVSNGGGAVLRAAELNAKKIIDAVVAAEPQINIDHQYQLKDISGVKSITTKPLIELSMHMSLYEPCAALDVSLNDAPFKLNTVLIQGLQQARCQALHQHGYLKATDTITQASESLKIIEQLQIERSAWQLSHLNTLANIWGAINHTYSNSYLKTTAQDNLCQSAMSAFTPQGQPRELTEAEYLNMFALSNGIAPSNGIELAYTNKNNEVQSKMVSAAQLGFESQDCFFQLLKNPKLQLALKSIKLSPENNHLPTIILHGQADGTVAINHASRAYYHRNQNSEEVNQFMRYYEIEHVQHFDAFLAYPGFDQKFVPMHPYFEQALDIMYEHLFSDSILPQSQLIKTQPREATDSGKTTALNQQHIPTIKSHVSHKITLDQQQLEVE